MTSFETLAATAAALGGLAAIAYLMSWSSRRQRHAAVHRQSIADGVTTPAALHPRIRADACICTGACIDACPEKDALGWVRGRPVLINPSACVGHGACLAACPVDAIELVIGSEDRPVELPVLSPSFESSVAGVYVSGELAGMGLIHNAIKQGRQAVDAVARALAPERADPAVLDLVIAGAGPAGIGAAVEARRLGLRYRLLEKGQLGGAIRSYPRQKIVMTSPVDLPGYGRFRLGRTTKEALLELIDDVRRVTGIEVTEGCEVLSVERKGGELVVHTRGEALRARTVLLATGRRGAPRRLGVPGEDRTKVAYELIEPEQYRGRRCVVVGGGDSAVETAMMLADAGAQTVDLVHRGARFDRIKPDNRRGLDAAAAADRLRVRTSADVTAIDDDAVELRGEQVDERIANDFVFVCIGGELPTALLARAGIDVARFTGEPPGSR